MTILILGLFIFFAIHSVRIVAPGLRMNAIATMGEGGWKRLFSAIAAVGLALIVWGWMSYRLDAPFAYAPPIWGRHVTYTLVLFAFILLAAAYVPTGYIKTFVRHPFLTAVALWGLGHLLANGDMAGLLLFGTFLAYAVIDRIAVMFRTAPPSEKPAWQGDAIAIGIGLVAYVFTLFWAHELLFDVSPLA